MSKCLGDNCGGCCDEPPIKSMTGKKIISDYRKRRPECEKCCRDAWVHYCGKPRPIADAIVSAATARNAKNKKHSHQWRVANAKLAALAGKLKPKADEIENAQTFDRLLEIIESTGVFHRGALANYDTALRLGCRLKKCPDKIYLHAGTRKGAMVLLKKKRLLSFILKQDLPEPYKSSSLRECELEDILCIYKDCFR